MRFTIEENEIYIAIDDLIEELQVVVLMSHDEAFSDALESVLRVLHNDRETIEEQLRRRKRWWRRR